ncbi:MAG: NarK/NasA family nitrate transporter, partial [Nitrospirae bacterium]|nr:NarK/NasA family nitrate transporter [Candidatus Troglogloeales bacterium]
MAKIIQAIRSGHPPTLFSAFLYFDVSFMIWVLIGALGIFISKDLGLTVFQKSVLVAIPILGGAIFRVIAGVLVDRFGPKKIGLITLSMLVAPLTAGWLWAASFSQFIIIGLLLGVAGASFVVALPLASRCYPPEHQGIAMGIAGAGNSGSVIILLVAPFLAKMFGWHAVFGLALIPLLITLIVFALLAKDIGVLPPPASFSDYWVFLKQTELWWFNLYYSATFGGFVGLAGFLSIFLNDQYHISPVVAGGLTALCVFSASFFRPIGGHLADRIGGAKVLTGLYLIATILFSAIAFLPPLPIAVILFVLGMVAFGMGNGAIFQWIPQRFPSDIGIVTGLVGAFGGVGGFLLPMTLGAMKGISGSYGGGFLLFAAMTLSCLLSLLFRTKSVENVARSDQQDEGRV